MSAVPAPGRKRDPFTYSAPSTSAPTNKGISAGSVEPSASIVTTTSPVARANPARSAAPLPARGSSTITTSGRTIRATPIVESVERPSTTITSYSGDTRGRTSGRFSASFSVGMTTVTDGLRLSRRARPELATRSFGPTLRSSSKDVETSRFSGGLAADITLSPPARRQDDAVNRTPRRYHLRTAAPRGDDEETLRGVHEATEAPAASGSRAGADGDVRGRACDREADGALDWLLCCGFRMRSTHRRPEFRFARATCGSSREHLHLPSAGGTRRRDDAASAAAGRCRLRGSTR